MNVPSVRDQVALLMMLLLFINVGNEVHQRLKISLWHTFTAPGKKPKRESRDIREFIPFSGQGRRLGGSDDRKVQGESSEVPQRQNGLPSQRGSNSHPLENCGSDESHKTLMKDKTNISIAAKVHDENQSQKTFFQASHKDDSLVHPRKGKDPESRRKNWKS